MKRFSRRSFCGLFSSPHRALGACTLALSIGLMALAGFASAAPLRLEGHGGPIRSVAVDDAGKRALSASFDYSAILWDISGEEAEIRERLLGHDAAVNDIVFVPGRNLAVSASDDGTVGVWNLENGELIARFEAQSGKKFVDVEVSADGRLAAAAGWDNLAYVYDLEEMRELAVMSGHRGLVNTLGFSSDGERLFTGSFDGTVRMWDARTGDLFRTIHRHGWAVNVLRVLSGDNHILFGAVDGASAILHIETGESVIDLEPHEGPVLSLAVDEAARFVATGGGDGRIHLYAMDGWILEENHENPYGPVWALAFVPGGRTLLHAGLDDFAIGWRFSPRAPFEPVESTYPRRFQVRGEMDPGEEQFARKCSVCHTLSPDDANRAGPTLHGVFGREAGTLAGYPFSQALIDSRIVWDGETIAQLFDLGPDIVTPGTKMPIQRIKDPEELDALVAFLRRATALDGQDENTDETGGNR